MRRAIIELADVDGAIGIACQILDENGNVAEPDMNSPACKAADMVLGMLEQQLLETAPEVIAEQNERVQVPPKRLATVTPMQRAIQVVRH